MTKNHKQTMTYTLYWRQIGTEGFLKTLLKLRQYLMKKILVKTAVNCGYLVTRDLSRDDCIEEFIKRI